MFINNVTAKTLVIADPTVLSFMDRSPFFIYGKLLASISDDGREQVVHEGNYWKDISVEASSLQF